MHYTIRTVLAVQPDSSVKYITYGAIEPRTRYKQAPMSISVTTSMHDAQDSNMVRAW